MVKDPRDARKCLLGTFCRKCVLDVVGSLGYLLYFIRNVWGGMCFWPIQGNVIERIYLLLVRLSLSNQKYQAFPLCAEMVVPSYIVGFIFNPWKLGFVPLLLCSFMMCLNSLRPRQYIRHFADDIFKCIFLKENVWIAIKIPLKFVPRGPINNIPALV